MDYPRNNVFTYLFSTYKKTAGIAFVIVLILAVPITIALLGRQQDIRQRAQSPSDDAVTPAPTNTPTCMQKPLYCTPILSTLDILPFGNFDNMFPMCTEPPGGWCSETQPVVSPEQPSSNNNIETHQGSGSNTGATYQTPGPNQQLVLNQQKFDFNDDGKVDEIDLNILYAGFAKRVGD